MWRQDESWGDLRGLGMPHGTRDQVADWVRRWNQKTGLSKHCFIGWLGLPTSKFYDRQARYGQVNERNGWVLRDFWLEEWEIRPSMTTADVETILQRAGEKFPGASPRVVSDNGPQFIARDFAERDRQLEEARQQTCQRA